MYSLAPMKQGTGQLSTHSIKKLLISALLMVCLRNVVYYVIPAQLPDGFTKIPE